MTWLLRAGMRHGWRRGVVGGNRAWVVVGGAALVGHLARRALAREEDVIWSGELGPGQVLDVKHEA
ncbi:MAG: hypothetical protein ACRDY0_03675 [Acidimicrobiales bacterium]